MAIHILLNKMRIDAVELKTFRNIAHLKLSFDDNLIIFVGDNGQGKTNIIESFVYLASGRSFRTAKDHHLIQRNAEFSKIDAHVLKDNKVNQLQVVLSEFGKYMTVNQRSLKKASEFLGHCNIVLFAPDDLNFFIDSPKNRRKNIDYELGKLSRHYLDYLSKVNHIISERNSYLKTNSVDEDFLDILTDNLILNSIPIIEQRKRFCESLNPLIAKYYKLFSESDDTIRLNYESQFNKGESLDATYLKQKYNDSIRRDRQFGLTHVGVHRDDFVFEINDVVVSQVASQGQKRMIMLAYKFAIIELVKDLIGEYPILCLDDLFSELDMTRRRLVLDTLPDAMQVFITTTDTSFVQTRKKHVIYRIKDGNGMKEVSHDE
ncbi:DNA replication/repair protein RecF [Erysipelothrix inopinata]